MDEHAAAAQPDEAVVKDTEDELTQSAASALLDEKSDDTSSVMEGAPDLDDDLGEKAAHTAHDSSSAIAGRIEEENSVDPFEVDDELEKLLDGENVNGEEDVEIEKDDGEELKEPNLEEVPMEEELFLEENNTAPQPPPAEESKPTESAAQEEEEEEGDELDDLLSDLEGDGEGKNESNGAQKKEAVEAKADDDFDFDLEDEEDEKKPKAKKPIEEGGKPEEKKDETRAALFESIFGGDDEDDEDLDALLTGQGENAERDEYEDKKGKKRGSKKGKRKADAEDRDIEKKTKRRLEEILQQKDEKEKKKQRGKKSRKEADADFDEGSDVDEAPTTKKKRRRASTAGEDAPKRKRRSKKSVEAREEGEEGGGAEGEAGGEEEKSDFDLVVEKMKKSNRRRRNQLEPQQIYEMVDSLLNKMADAVDADIRANREKAPAVSKVKLLPEVVAMLHKVHLQDAFIDRGGLRAVKQWLEPLPDGSLPNYNLRRDLLNILPKLPIESDHLRESGLGKVVMFLWKSPKETKENKAVAQELIQNWSRPIFQLSLNYKDLADHERQRLEQRRSLRRSNSQSQSGSSQADDSLDSIVGSRSRAIAEKEEFSYHARIPQPADKDYVNRPVSQVELPTPSPGSKNNPSRQKKFERRLSELKLKRKGRTINAQSRAARLSIEGRNLHI